MNLAYCACAVPFAVELEQVKNLVSDKAADVHFFFLIVKIPENNLIVGIPNLVNDESKYDLLIFLINK